jgi:AraC-like DNA-binding protein
MTAMSTTKATYGIRVQKGPNSCRNCESYGHPTSNRPDQKVGKMCQVLQDEIRLTINDVRNILYLSQGTCRRIFNEELNMRRTATKLVPSPPNDNRKHSPIFCVQRSFLVLTVPKHENRVKLGKI